MCCRGWRSRFRWWPPLAVAGVCLGQRRPTLAFGAAVLFASNVLSLVIAGTLVLAGYRYAPAGRAADRRRRMGYLSMAVVPIVLLLPRGANTAANVLVNVWTQRIAGATDQWIAPVRGAAIAEVAAASRTAHIDVITPQALPPIASLLAALPGQLPPV
jgi:hypothetical protein